MRLFTALELPLELREIITAKSQQIDMSRSKVRSVPIEHYHCTLNFLGEVEESKVEAVASVVEKIGRSTPRFDAVLSTIGCFPKSGPVKVVWCGIDNDNQAASILQLQLAEEFAELGFEPEARAYHPHITIGRVKEDKSKGSLRRSIAAAPAVDCLVDFDGIVLMQSILSSQGAEYRPLIKADFR